MFKRILVALDGSTYSEPAVPAAIELAQKFDGEIFVIHVSEHDRGRAAAYTLESPAEATRLVANAVERAKNAGVAAKGELIDKGAGHVAQAIEETVTKYRVDLVVMGSRGLSDVQSFLSGSVSHQVLQQLDVPVLIVRGFHARPMAAAAAGPQVTES